MQKSSFLHHLFFSLILSLFWSCTVEDFNDDDRVFRYNESAGITTLDISFLNSGPYFVKIQGINEEWQTKQLIIANNE